MPERDGEPSGQSALLNTAGSVRSLNPVHARFSGAGTQTSRDAPQSDRDLLEENRDGARRGGGASARDRWFWPWLSAALSVQAHGGHMGQRCLRCAVGGTSDLLEALCRNASGEESVETQTACRAVLAGDRDWGCLF